VKRKATRKILPRVSDAMHYRRLVQHHNLQIRDTSSPHPFPG
jgi:hypothetical protein